MSRLAGERPFPYSAGFVAGSATSQAAAQDMNAKLGELHQKVLRLFRNAEAAGIPGLTDERLQHHGNTPSILRPRRVELTRQGYIKDSGQVEVGLSGKENTVWQLTDKGRAA